MLQVLLCILFQLTVHNESFSDGQKGIAQTKISLLNESCLKKMAMQLKNGLIAQLNIMIKNSFRRHTSRQNTVHFE